MKLNKKGQITIFIIIAIIILFATALIFYTKNKMASIPKKEVEPVLEQVPVEMQPLQAYITECVEKTAVEGLEAIGRSGGYTNPADYGISSLPLNPTEYPSSALNFGGKWDIAYWWYLDSKNNCDMDCMFNSKMPPLKRNEDSTFMKKEASIETQLDKYVNENLKKCLRDFSSFKSQGFRIKELGNVKTTATVAEKDIRVSVSYPIEVQSGDRKTKLSNYYKIIPLNIKAVYELAGEILNAEAGEKYIEGEVLSLISLYSGIDSAKLPPMDDSLTGFGTAAFWTEYQTKERMQQILTSYIPGLQVPGSINYENRVLLEPAYSLYNGQMDVPVEGNPSLAVRFEYLNWPIYLYTGSEGGVITCESVGITFPAPVGVTRCSTSYDLSIPVAVEIYDPNALNKKGYSFRFAMEGCIRNNEPCSDAVSINSVNVPTGSMLCDINQRTSEEITFSTMDSEGNPLNDVMVSYTCVSESCDIGVTDEKGILKTKVPPCVGAVVTFRKPDYLGISRTSASPSIVINEGEGHDPITATLEKSKGVNINVKKVVKTKMLDSNRWLDTLSEPKELDADEKGLITMTRVKKNLDGTVEEDYPPAVYQFDNTGKLNLKLVPGDYEVSIYLMRSDPLVIPKCMRKEGNWLKSVKFWMPGPEHMVLNERGKDFPSGGLVLNQKTGYLHLSREDLDKEITFRAISHNLFELWEANKDQWLYKGKQCGIIIEDLDMAMGDLEKQSIEYKGVLVAKK